MPKSTLPEPMRHDDAWLPDFIGSSDRSCALAGVAYLDFALNCLLLTYLRDDVSENEAKAIEEEFFGISGMLRDFSRKVKMLYFLGGISESEAHQEIHLILPNRIDVLAHAPERVPHLGLHMKTSGLEIDTHSGHGIDLGPRPIRTKE